MSSETSTEPQAGSTALAISSGAAREPGDPAYKPLTVDKGYSHGTPPGYPKESPACKSLLGSGQAQDGVALELTIRVPSNAHSFSYQQNFFTSEYPEFICNQFNDFFVALLNSSHPSTPPAECQGDWLAR